MRGYAGCSGAINTITIAGGGECGTDIITAAAVAAAAATSSSGSCCRRVTTITTATATLTNVGGSRTTTDHAGTDGSTGGLENRNAAATSF